MDMYSDTICAPATAAGDAGIAIIRLSGEGAFAAMKAVFFKKTEVWEPRKMYLGEIKRGERLIDTALGVYFPAPFSYTGEDVCELHCHGGRMASQLAMQALLEKDVRMALPGEFSKRAFLNGKIDVTQAEAVQQLISSLSEKGAELSARQLRGDLKRRIDGLKDRLTDVIASIEAGVEYPEEEEEQSMAMSALPAIEELAEELFALERTYDSGRIMREGLDIAIAGRPNVGKSSLLNAILGEDRAIVASIPGTTRDSISEYFDLRTIPVKFTDTAGIRDSGDEIEQIGVQRSRNALKNADLVLFLLDASQSVTGEDAEVFRSVKDTRHIVVLNKTDIACLSTDDVEKAFGETPIEICAKDGSGVETLLDEIFSRVSMNERLTEGVAISSLRQKSAVSSAARSISDASRALSSGVDMDCVSIDLADAWRALCEITGEALTEDIVDRIFEKFCLGK